MLECKICGNVEPGVDETIVCPTCVQHAEATKGMTTGEILRYKTEIMELKIIRDALVEQGLRRQEELASLRMQYHGVCATLENYKNYLSAAQKQRDDAHDTINALKAKLA